MVCLLIDSHFNLWFESVVPLLQGTRSISCGHTFPFLRSAKLTPLSRGVPAPMFLFFGLSIVFALMRLGVELPFSEMNSNISWKQVNQEQNYPYLGFHTQKYVTFFIIDALCISPLLIQGITLACTCSCIGSSDELLGATIIFTKPIRQIIFLF